MGISDIFNSIGDGLTTAVDKVGDIGGSLGDDVSGLLGGGDLSGIFGALGLSSLFGGSNNNGSTDWKTYLEYGGIAIGIILLAVLIKKLI